MEEKEQKNPTKTCKYCQSEIPKKAKVCPVCRKKQKGKLKWIIILLILIVVIAAAIGGGENEESENQETEQIEYTSVTVNDMMSALDENALSAADTYEDKYLEITGRLGNIDSSGDYITLYTDNEFDIIGVQCYIQNDSQLDAVRGMSVGHTVTIQGLCTDVGEVMGYSVDINNIVE